MASNHDIGKCFFQGLLSRNNSRFMFLKSNPYKKGVIWFVCGARREQAVRQGQT